MILKKIREVDKDEKNYICQPDFTGHLSVKRAGLCLASRPFWDFRWASSMGRSPGFLLPGILSAACLLWTGLLQPLQSLGAWPLASEMDSLRSGEGLDSRLLAVSVINKGIEVESSIPFVRSSKYPCVCLKNTFSAFPPDSTGSINISN